MILRTDMRIPLRPRPLTITLLCVLGTMGLFLYNVPLLEMVELSSYDLRFLLRGKQEPSATVVIAAIDEKSLDAEGRWPWPRSKIARLVDVLSQDGAKVIGFDIGFLEPEKNEGVRVIDRLEGRLQSLGLPSAELGEILNAIRAEADNDLALAHAIAHSTAAVVLGYFFHTETSGLGQGPDPEILETQLDRILPSRYPLVRLENPEQESVPVIKAVLPEANLDILARATPYAGFFNILADSDGVVRRMPLVIDCDEELFPPLGIQCAWHSLAPPFVEVKVGLQGVEGIRMGERLVPTDETGRLLLNYLGPPGTFPHVSATDIIHGRVKPGTFRNRVVLVGGTAMGIIADVRNTPFGASFPGVEIHATLIDNILTGRFLSKPRWAGIYDLAAIALLGGLAGLLLPRLNAVKGLSLTGSLFAAHILATRWLFTAHGIWLNMVYPLSALLLTHVGQTAYHYLTEERERKRIRGAFSRYVSDQVIREMLARPDRLKLGGEVKTLSVVFSDLAGFTSHSERLAPEEMIELLSDYFGEMTARVFEFQGTLKEYVGDELMAIFGAPLEQPDHAARACRAALAMRDRLAELRRSWTETGRPALRARTGINSGPMLVGNLGSRYRFAYGVLGDQVNLGSRLEGLNKIYGTEILVGENTVALLEGGFLLREIDQVRVKGRRQPVRIYELLGKAADSLPEDLAAALTAYEQGLEAYRVQRWEKAMEAFERAWHARPDDKASRIMFERCLHYREVPPPPDWDGVFQALSK